MTQKSLFAAGLLALPLAGLASLGTPASAMPMIDPSPAVLTQGAPATKLETVYWHRGWGPGPHWHRPWGWHHGYGWHRPWGWHRGYGWHHRWHRW